MDKTISIAALVVASAAGVVAVTKPDTTKMVAASASEDDTAVAAVVQESGVRLTNCCLGWASVDENKPVWLCDDSGYNPKRQAWLSKKASAVGEPVSCISFDARELDTGNVKVDVKIQKGEAPAKPPVPVVEEPKAEIGG